MADNGDQSFETWWEYFRRNAWQPLVRPLVRELVNQVHQEKLKALKAERHRPNTLNIEDEIRATRNQLVHRKRKGPPPLDAAIAAEFVRILEWAKGNSQRIIKLYDAIFVEGLDAWLATPRAIDRTTSNDERDQKEKEVAIRHLLESNPKLKEWRETKRRLVVIDAEPNKLKLNAQLPTRSKVGGDRKKTQWLNTWKADLLIKLCKHLGKEPTAKNKAVLLNEISGWPWPIETDSFELVETRLKQFHF